MKINVNIRGSREDNLYIECADEKEAKILLTYLGGIDVFGRITAEDEPLVARYAGRGTKIYIKGSAFLDDSGNVFQYNLTNDITKGENASHLWKKLCVLVPVFNNYLSKPLDAMTTWNQWGYYGRSPAEQERIDNMIRESWETQTFYSTRYFNDYPESQQHQLELLSDEPLYPLLAVRIERRIPREPGAPFLFLVFPKEEIAKIVHSYLLAELAIVRGMSLIQHTIAFQCAAPGSGSAPNMIQLAVETSADHSHITSQTPGIAKSLLVDFLGLHSRMLTPSINTATTLNNEFNENILNKTSEKAEKYAILNIKLPEALHEQLPDYQPIKLEGSNNNNNNNNNCALGNLAVQFGHFSLNENNPAVKLSNAKLAITNELASYKMLPHTLIDKIALIINSAENLSQFSHQVVETVQYLLDIALNNRVESREDCRNTFRSIPCIILRLVGAIKQKMGEHKLPSRNDAIDSLSDELLGIPLPLGDDMDAMCLQRLQGIKEHFDTKLESNLVSSYS